MTTSLAVQLATSPKLIGVSIESGAKTLSLVRSGACFSLSLLAKSERAIVRKFVKPASLDLDSMELNVSTCSALVFAAPRPPITVEISGPSKLPLYLCTARLQI